MSEKITANHRARIAYVHVRQSSPHQVQHNLESQRLQYGLADKARQRGFIDVRTIDEDLGLSAAEADKRVGFQKLVTEVSLRHVGMTWRGKFPGWRATTPIGISCWICVASSIR